MTAEAIYPPLSEPRLPIWRSRRFLGAVCAIGGVQLMATMDGPIVVFALSTIQRELGLSDAGRNMVITAYLLTFGGLVLLGGQLGDILGRKRTFLLGVGLFTAASVLCGVAWDGGVLVMARLLHGAAAAIVAPTSIALVASTFPKGPARNAAAAAFGAMAAIGAVLGIVVGGMLCEFSWRLAFLINVPIGLVVVYLAHAMLTESRPRRVKPDIAGGVLATVVGSAAVFGLSAGSEQGWYSAAPLGCGIVVLLALLAFIAVERAAENPIVPLALFVDRSRLATFGAMFLSRGVGFTLTVLVVLYVQNLMGYSPLSAGIAFVPFTIAMAVGTVLSSRWVVRFAPRTIVIAGMVLVLGATLYGSTIHRDMAYFPGLMLPMAVGAFGLGMTNVPLGLSLIAGVGEDRIGATSSVAVMVQSLGGPLVLAVIQAVMCTRPVPSAGVPSPAVLPEHSAARLDLLDASYTLGLLWLGAIVVATGVVALFIGYTAQQVAHAQRARKAVEDAEF